MTKNLPGGKNYYFGLFHNNVQIGFQCFTNYMPKNKKMYHSNRTVIHPDYSGLGVGIKLINVTSQYVYEKYNLDVRACFSSTPVFKSMIKQKSWEYIGSKIPSRSTMKNSKMERANEIRIHTKMHSFKFIPGNKIFNHDTILSL